ncbi:MAG TPA: hypothetical protein VM100_05390, partial [Longimicrobiales bacterium]|nr:hypothetical protein [Longimicrobiales bacterium]
MFRQAGVLLAFVCVAAPVGAQKRIEPPKGLSDSAQVLYKQLIELMPQVRAAEVAFRRTDAAKRRDSEEPLDTLRLGPYLVVAPDMESKTAFSAFQAAFETRKDKFDGVSGPF